MSSIGPKTMVDQPTAAGRSRRTSHLGRFAGLISLGLAVAAATGYALLTHPDRTDPLVISDSGTVILDRTIDRPIEIAADNVTIRKVTIRSGGNAAIRVRPGVTGALIEDSLIRCTTAGTDGIVPGRYSALRVRTHGCRRPFLQDPNAPASIVDSQQDGAPYSADSAVPGPAAGPVVPLAEPTPLSYWPGPTTTGVPAGTVLKNSGSLTLRTAGQVVTGLNITGCVSVFASNVTISNSRITCNSTTYSIRQYPGATSLLIQDVEINGAGKNSASICCDNYTLRRANVYNAIDGPRVGNNTTIIDSWIHDLARITGSHNDTLQTTAGVGILIQHNRLEPYNVPLRDPMNACMMIGSTTGPTVTRMLMIDNYCNGGNYSIGIKANLVASDVSIRGNKFGRNYRYGIATNTRLPGVVWDRVTNVWFDTGQPVPVT